MDVGEDESIEEKFKPRLRNAALLRSVRGGRFIARRRAVIALLLIGILACIVALVGTEEPVGQVGLVTIGVLVSFILLPDTPFRLWNVTATDLADTIPGDKLVHASRSLSEAMAVQSGGQLPSTAVTTMWDSRLAEILLLIDNPALVVFDLNYRVVITPDDAAGALISSTISAIRCVPLADETVWFSFCSDHLALTEEFKKQSSGCIGREMIELRSDENIHHWIRRINDYRVELMVDGEVAARTSTVTKFYGDNDSCAVRVSFESGRIAQEFVGSELKTEFRAEPGLRTFPVKFSSYFCIGATSITFELMDPSAHIVVNEFFSATSRSVLMTGPLLQMDSKVVWFRAQEDTVLPPGVGAVFTWDLRKKLVLDELPSSLLSLLPEGTPLAPSINLPAERHEVIESNEPLVEVVDVSTFDAYATMGILPPRRTLVRRGVADRLRRIAKSLPADFGIVILDGWRSSDDQKALIDYYRQFGPIDGYVAFVSEDGMRAPHTTGGAVDLTLTWKGMPLRLGSGFDDFNDLAHSNSFEPGDGAVRRLRRLLSSAMRAEDFAPYPLEWWHWTYGEDVWAQTTGGNAIYDVIE
ncbi:MAG: M15 family metallopeptidase [Acidimicrobiales bacterium]|jgi:D-alanyl-D-alanine dipeptidase